MISYSSFACKLYTPCSTRHSLHALKGQKYIAQGIALGKISQKQSAL